MPHEFTLISDSECFQKASGLKKKKDRTHMEATNIINSSFEDFVTLMMGQLIYWHRAQRLFVSKWEKKSRENLKIHIYSIYIYI